LSLATGGILAEGAMKRVEFFARALWYYWSWLFPNTPENTQIAAVCGFGRKLPKANTRPHKHIRKMQNRCLLEFEILAILMTQKRVKTLRCVGASNSNCAQVLVGSSACGYKRYKLRNSQ
jgi:hypothetical protein